MSSLRKLKYFVFSSIVLTLLTGCLSEENEKHKSKCPCYATSDHEQTKSATKTHAQKIKILSITNDDSEPNPEKTKVIVSISYTLYGTKLGTIRVVHLSKGRPTSQGHKIITEGQGIISIPIEYSSKNNNDDSEIISILYRDRQESSGTIDKRKLKALPQAMLVLTKESPQ